MKSLLAVSSVIIVILGLVIVVANGGNWADYMGCLDAQEMTGRLKIHIFEQAPIENREHGADCRESS
jgi:hypothetical protein